MQTKTVLQLCCLVLLTSFSFDITAATLNGFTERKGAFKHFTWPKKVRHDSMTRKLDSTAIGLNIFELTPEAGSAAICWQDGSAILLKAVKNTWQVYCRKPGEKSFTKHSVVNGGRITAAFHGTGLLLQDSKGKLHHVYGGFSASGVSLLLPEKVKTPVIKPRYIIDDVLLYCTLQEVENEFSKAEKLFKNNLSFLQKAPGTQNQIWSWRISFNMHKQALAKVRQEVLASNNTFLPALAEEPLLRDSFNLLLWLSTHEAPVGSGNLGGRMREIWYTHALGRGELYGALNFCGKVKRAVARAKRVSGEVFNEAYNSKNQLAGGFVSALTRVPKNTACIEKLQPQADLRCARGEKESIQMVLSCGSKSMDNITVEAVKNDPSAPDLKLAKIEYVSLTESPIQQFPQEENGETLESDVCIPLEKNTPVNILPYSNQPILITAMTMNNTAPGTYSYKLNVLKDGKKLFALPLTVKVEKFALGNRLPGLPGIRPNNIDTWYGAGTPAAEKARRNMMLMMLEHRMEPLDLYRKSPNAEDLPWIKYYGLQAVLLDGRLERLADPRPAMVRYIELYGSVDGKKFERIPAKVILDKCDRKNPLSASDLLITPQKSMAHYKYCKIHYSQPTHPFDRFQRHFYDVRSGKGKTLEVNGNTMIADLRFIRPDHKKLTSGMKDAVKFDQIKFDVLNNNLFYPSLIWENKTGEIKNLRLYNHLRDNYLKEVGAYYNLVRSHLPENIPVYLYGFDENEKYYNEQMVSAIKNARQAFKNVRIVTTACNVEATPELFDMIDYHCVGNGNANSRRNEYISKNRRMKYWTYIGGGAYYPFGNFERIDQMRINSRAFFWSMIAFDYIEGWLYWSINYWNCNMHLKDMKDMNWTLWNPNHEHVNGMQALFYPGKNGEIYPSLRLSAMRDGLEDVELFRLALSKVRTKADKAELEAIRNGFARSMSVYCRDENKLKNLRNRLFDLLDKLTDDDVKITPKEFNNFGYPVKNLFHPSVTVLKDGRWMATMQDVSNSDFYGEPLFSISSNKGRTWSKPQVIKPLGNTVRASAPGFIEGVADPRPFTLQDGSVIVIGCSNFYLGDSRANTDKKNFSLLPVTKSYYTIWDKTSQQWGPRYELELPGFGNRAAAAACIQICLWDEDKIIVPFYVDADANNPHPGAPERFAVMSAVYRKVNGKLKFIAQSRTMTLPVKRGMVEPSVVQLPDKSFAMTIRAEDLRMYCSFSPDGVSWSEPQVWCWDDGVPLTTNSTQQHWLKLGKRLFLVYTRFDGSNFPKPWRYRGPLYMAEAVPGKTQLIRNSEKVVFNREKINGVDLRFGNFHCTQQDDNSALVTDAAYYAEITPNGKHHNIQTIVKAAEITAN